MRHILTALAAVSLALGAQPAGAWGSQGHQLVGSIADGLLTPNARRHVQQILGISLQTAATWPDCVRSVKKANGGFAYFADPNMKVWCRAFETPAGKAQMVAYAKANWNQCVDADPGRACHAKYHFADEPAETGAYAFGDPGTNDHDVVHAINAALAKLEGKPVPAPFRIRTNAEALRLLAHFVGDIHQPLHAGAEYLDPGTGAVLDPPAFPDKRTETQGGNLIMYTHSENLHGTWDTIPKSWGVDGSALLTEARGLSPTPGDRHGWAASWASDSIALSRAKAFAGLEFTGQVERTERGHTVKVWTISNRPADYADTLHATQRAQIVKGGRHLADILNAIWP
jgi:hypothetical protein